MSFGTILVLGAGLAVLWIAGGVILSKPEPTSSAKEPTVEEIAAAEEERWQKDIEESHKSKR